MWEEKEKEKEEKEEKKEEKKFLPADKRKVVQVCKFAEKEPDVAKIGRNFALSMQKVHHRRCWQFSLISAMNLTWRNIHVKIDNIK